MYLMLVGNKKNKYKMEEPLKFDLTQIDFNKYWEMPLSKGAYSELTDKVRKTRQDFINEYYPSGHKIYDTTIYPNLWFKIKENSGLGKAIGEKYKDKVAWKEVKRKRISIPIQQDATRVILAHIFGNPIVHKDISPIKSENSQKAMATYKNLWNYYNMDSHVRNFFGRSLICGDAAFFLTINERKEIIGKTLSFLDGDMLAIKQDIKGEVLEIYRQYSATNELNEKEVYIDVITQESITTYKSGGEFVSQQQLVYSFIPAVYHCRKDGAWWSFVQPNIDELEIELSDLAQDNKSKAKGKYFMSTTTPQKVKLETFADSDVFIADRYSDMKFIEPTTMSEAFKYTMEENKEIISHSLGYIFPKVQNSGDMPTGSMKAQFYPTERICMEFINEFAPILDEISWIFQQLVDALYPELRIGDVKISSKIKLFSPTDNISKVTAFADALAKNGATPRSIVNNNPDFFDSDDEEYLEKLLQEKLEIDKMRYANNDYGEDEQEEMGNENQQIGFHIKGNRE